jgi:hypothetical protein
VIGLSSAPYGPRTVERRLPDLSSCDLVSVLLQMVRRCVVSCRWPLHQHGRAAPFADAR